MQTFPEISDGCGMVSGGVCGVAHRLATMRPPMKYDEDYRSDYVDDRRGTSGGGGRGPALARSSASFADSV
ncbi:MAG: hypothetical protein JKY37_00385 [Nannocystaceae bacterium]|nr:hypothetical protein [Nannocystaceae bacterium]